MFVPQTEQSDSVPLPNRRTFLRSAILSAAGMSLPDQGLANAVSRPYDASKVSRDSAVILIWLDGGPSHIDTYDCKGTAPAEYRGPMGTARTNVPDIDICDLLPQQARIMNRLAVIRSLHHDTNDHFAAAHWMLTGKSGSTAVRLDPIDPSAGSIASLLRGSNHQGVPAYAAVPVATSVGLNPGYHGAAHLGSSYDPFQTGVSQANSSPMHKAFDVECENPRLRERYGRHEWGRSCLLARRLVEHGVTFVTVHMSGWDDHANIEQGLRHKLPRFDRAVATLVEDLVERGMYGKVAICVCGEFGRAPRINRDAGRDHWGKAGFCLLGGGGLRTGLVVGATDRLGEQPRDRPVTPGDVIATLYHVLGIDPRTTILDRRGKPQPLLPDGTAIADLL